MRVLRGIGVGGGIAIGPALKLDREGVRIPRAELLPSAVEAEVGRLRAALESARKDALEGRDDIAERIGPSYGAIFAAHAMLMDDPGFVRSVEGFIRDRLLNAEYALSETVRVLAKRIEALGPTHFLASRSADLYDVEKRVLARLADARLDEVLDVGEPAIAVAHDLSPSQTAQLDPAKVFGFATESGGRASHTAILAGALGLPAVVGLGRFLSDLSGGDQLIVDAVHGELVIDPDPDTLARYERMRAQEIQHAGYWVVQRDLPCETLDGTAIKLMGNIEFPSEAAHVAQRGADGIGLYRTEFLYVGRKSDPSEEEHYQAYMTALRELGPGKPLVIRTLDLGADKFGDLPWIHEPEKNPYLGLRSVRLCLRHKPLFKTQLRAILRASAAGDIRIMFPMISTVRELQHCILMLEEVKEDLRDEGVAFNAVIPVGTMVEVPSAALMAENLARQVDFFSIGTNDLVQYTLAADRNNEHVADLYTPADPAVLRLIGMVVKAANAAKIGVNVCGEMSGDPLFIPLLLGMGLRQLSVTPHHLPEAKRIIRLTRMADAERVAQEALRMESATEVTNHLTIQLRRLMPELVE